MEGNEELLLKVITKTALLLTVGSFFTGIPVCRTIWERKSSTGIPYAPFLAGVISSYLWLRYGFMENDQLCIQVNTIGICMTMFYALFYFFMSRTKIGDGVQALIALSTVSMIVVLNMSSMDPKFWAGLSACCASIVAAASPLVSIKKVLQTKSTEVLPFPMIFLTFWVTAVWLTYGLLTGNQFIVNQNAVCLAIAGFQLFLFIIFPSATNGSSLEKKMK